MREQAQRSLDRLLPRLEQRFRDAVDEVEWIAYVERFERHFPRLFNRLYGLYGGCYDFFYHLESIVASATAMWIARPPELKALDAMRGADPYWYQSNRMVGAMCYVDLFAGDLARLRERIPYLTEMGITYLHLMPLFRTPSGDDDGGYAVSSYREVDPSLGTMEQLAELATELRHHGISLTLDFVFNHTSDEHAWARAALAGDKRYQQYYRMFPDRTLPDRFEQTMPEVFTEDHPGAFTYRTGIKKWVWTTFHTYQWDLNYENPEVFNRMLEEMLFLANQGVEILRLDAVAFIWKRLGTNSQNLPEAHWVIQAFNALVSIAAPAMVFKSEAIVHPDQVREYIGNDECSLSYNPQLMALLWDALATRDVRVLLRAMERRYAIPDGCAWVNYVRSHDDIGWAFADDDVAAVGFEPASHRRFLTRFFTGRFEGSFARGAPFQEDPSTGDARVSGTCASLTGIEQALEQGDEEELELAIRRVLLIHGVIIAIGGIPLIYLGDEIATLNDYGYDSDPEKIGDSRWLHRGAFDWERAEQRRDMSTAPGRVYQGLLRLLQVRGQSQAFAYGETEFLDSGNKHVFGFLRTNSESTVFVLANFSEETQGLEARRLRQMGMRKTMVDLFAGRTIVATQELLLDPYQILILAKAS
ncbi:MAG: alpha-glucosidase C-terminal domain-containing protein [Thiohalocapsa sp.]|jgi:amylosucrase/maltose alpha-D-glucosyltransferase/alpha-amylase|nr:alpha-glucosidase C-terminal domain-containing protein [Thiohalocapsa sp.]MCF7989369.1 alpha-glucosidase C-terminal domain-containing protein [Thiohalocapsa sp.]